MEIRHENIFRKMQPVLESKVKEFHLYGYRTVKENDIWAYCLDKVWRRKNIDELPIHQIVNDIFHISAAAYMTYTQIEAQRESDWFSEVNAEELQMLLGPQKRT